MTGTVGLTKEYNLSVARVHFHIYIRYPRDVEMIPSHCPPLTYILYSPEHDYKLLFFLFKGGRYHKPFGCHIRPEHDVKLLFFHASQFINDNKGRTTSLPKCVFK